MNNRTHGIITQKTRKHGYIPTKETIKKTKDICDHLMTYDECRDVKLMSEKEKLNMLKAFKDLTPTGAGLYEQIMNSNKVYYGNKFSVKDLENFINELGYAKYKSYDNLFHVGDVGMRYHTSILNNDEDALIDLHVEGKIKVLKMLSDIAKKYKVEFDMLEAITTKYKYYCPIFGEYVIQWELYDSNKEIEDNYDRSEHLILALTKEGKWVTYKEIVYDNPYQPVEKDYMTDITVDEIKKRYL